MLFVSDDGESIVGSFDAMTGLWRPSLEQPVLFFFHDKGTRARMVTVGDLYQRKSQLEHSETYFHWAHYVYLNKANQVVVELADGRRVAFAASTGLVQPLITDGT
ncbi:MAG TPA: hypothetical protein VEY92_11940 [Pseudoxanthomonas sp.]|nr:hypothetical protein [Pseudoxanthomonas sp.]